jgi:predicted TIM-barrel fold metal-dependent hydrolase
VLAALPSLVMVGNYDMLTDKLSRRAVCILGSTAFMGATMVDSVVAEEDPGWIDAHVHVWTPNVDRYPLAPGFSKENMQPSSFTPEELFAYCRPVGVKRIVLIQMSFYRLDNSYLTDAIQAYPGVFSGVGIVDHEADELDNQVSRLASQGVRGFRIHGSGDKVRQWINHPGMIKLWSMATAKNLAVCPLINPKDLAGIDGMCERFQETKVVIDHFARIGIDGAVQSADVAALCRLARFPNVHVKTSAFYALGAKTAPYRDMLPVIKKLVDCFGPQRLMWASDCPFQVQGNHRYEPSLALIRDASTEVLSQTDKQWILRDTAARVFFS